MDFEKWIKLFIGMTYIQIYCEGHSLNKVLTRFYYRKISAKLKIKRIYALYLKIYEKLYQDIILQIPLLLEVIIT